MVYEKGRGDVYILMSNVLVPEWAGWLGGATGVKVNSAAYGMLNKQACKESGKHQS